MSVHHALWYLISATITVTTVIYLAVRVSHFISSRPRRWMTK